LSTTAGDIEKFYVRQQKQGEDSNGKNATLGKNTLCPNVQQKSSKLSLVRINKSSPRQAYPEAELDLYRGQ